MTSRVASLYLPLLPIERLSRAERSHKPPELPSPPKLPIDDDPGPCSVPRRGGWRPGARWARDGGQAGRDRAIEALPAHQRPTRRQLGRRSEAAEQPFKAIRDGSSIASPPNAARALAGADPVQRPLILVGQVGPREVVTAACPAALSVGLAPGMPAAQARALVSDVDVRPADPEGDRTLLDRLALHAARHWTPTAAVAGDDGLWLDLSGVSHLFGGEERFCRRLVRFLARLGFRARVAVAGTPGAAHALARYGRQPIEILPSGAEAQALSPLPLSALRLDTRALNAASRFGIETVGDLLPMPRAPLARRLGLASITRLDQALGRIAEPVVGVVPFDAPASERRMLEPIGTAESIAQVISDLLGDLADSLRERGLGARLLHLVLDRVDGAEQRVVVGTARATRDQRHLARLFGMKIDRIDPGLGIEVMRLIAVRAEPLGATAIGTGLMDDSDATDIAPLVDQLAGRVGMTALFRVAPVESDVPERATERVPALDAPGSWPAWKRPSRMLSRPEPLSGVVALLPDHPPRRFGWRGEVHHVVAGDGPERVYGEWWVRDGEIAAVRDYYRVEDQDGGRFWIFRRGDGVGTESGDHSWWMHGAFG